MPIVKGFDYSKSASLRSTEQFCYGLTLKYVKENIDNWLTVYGENGVLLVRIKHDENMHAAPIIEPAIFDNTVTYTFR